MFRKKTLPALLLAAALLAGCAGKSGAPTQRTPEELAQVYSQAITDHGGEPAQYNPPVNQTEEFDPLMLEFLGLSEEDMTAFSISMSLMNVQAYAIIAAMPAQDKADTVEQALQTYKDNQAANFEMYLADQYEVARSARLETLADGTVLLVMCPGQDAVFEDISGAILEGAGG